MLAHGGVSTLTLVFALAFAGFYLASALAQVAVSALAQHVGEAEAGGPLEFRVFGTRIQYEYVLQQALTLLLVVAALYGIWRLTRAGVRTCPECHSEIPRHASVCRYCTADLPEPSS